jgi:DNA-binding CsgD family transcriptional regulator/PAS domain-containing protein
LEDEVPIGRLLEAIVAAMQLSQHALSNLIGSIYDCALDPSLWEQTLEVMRAALDCQEAAIRLSDLRSGSFLIYKAVGTEVRWEKEHANYLKEAHGYISDVLSSHQSFDVPHVLSRHVTNEFIQTSNYVQKFMLPQGIIDKMIWFLTKTPTRYGRIVVSRNRRQGPITDQQIELGTMLLPHLRRAVTISNMLDARTIERDRMSETLDSLRCAVILSDERGAIFHSNQSAVDMLRDGTLIQSVGNVLSANVATAAMELRAALRLAASNEPNIGKSGLAIRLSQPDLPPVFAHVLPLTGSDMRMGLHPAAIAAVFIAAAADEQDAASNMAVAFGLTPAETRVLASLLGGHSLKETATALRIAGTTAKTHLANIFSKTGVSRQADLMRLGTGLVPPTRSRM